MYLKKIFLAMVAVVAVAVVLAACGAGGGSASAGSVPATADGYAAGVSEEDPGQQAFNEGIMGGENDGDGSEGIGDGPEGIEDDAAGSEAEGLLSAKVVRVVDGDTIEVSLDGSKEKVRLIGIDTPESVHPDESKNVPYGKIASEFTRGKLDGKDVLLELDVEERDRYGRLLAYVYIDGVMFNKTLLDEGHAMVATYPPNVKYVEVFTEAQKAAREAGKGLWDIRGQEDTATPGAGQAGSEGASYIGTVTSYKFHTLVCEWGRKIAEHNAVYFESREEAIAAGFVPCKVCNP